MGVTFEKFGFTIEDYLEKELKIGMERGGRYACCPLHDEDTASFRYYEDEDTFYCFGCRIGGDIVVLHRALAAKEGRKISYKQSIDEVKRIVYKHTKNPAVLEKEKYQSRENYTIEGNLVVARKKEKVETTRSVTEETHETVTEKKPDVPSIQREASQKRDVRLMLQAVQQAKQELWGKNYGEAQKALFALESGIK